MANLQDLEAALIAADKAGNVEDAKQLAQAVASYRQLLPKQAPKPSFMENLAGGLVKGASEIGATLLTPVDAAAKAMGISNSFIGRDDRRQAVDDFMRERVDTDSLAYKGGKIGAEIAGTAGVPGALVKGLAKVPGVAAEFLPAVASGGFKSGGLTGLSGVANRAAGGAVAGAASAALINPNDAATGGLVGAAVPSAMVPLAIGGQKLGTALRNAVDSGDVKAARQIAQLAGMDEAALKAALLADKTDIAGYRATVPQILQNPAVSQLQRNIKSAGVTSLGQAEKAQTDALRGALNDIAPIGLSVNEAADRAGSAIAGYAVPARKAATDKVRDAFDAVDPFNESQLFLPIDEMKRAKGEFLGKGTFGTGSRATEAINTAEAVGTVELPKLTPLTQKAQGKTQSLEQAVRSAGGISGSSGELRDLGRRQSGTTGLINNLSGTPADLLAEKMFARGFIPDADPATLLEALRNGRGRKIFADDATESTMQGRMESAWGDMPDAERIAQAVPFGTVQNLRSSIGEAAEVAAAKGANKEAAALKKMIGEIDSRINRAAGGSAAQGEYFPQDMADQYRQALALHQKKMQQFETGPQVGLFRKGQDGQAAIAGAEIAPKFYSGRGSQIEDVQALKRLVGNRQDLIDNMKAFALTIADGTSNAKGEFTSKYLNWLKSHSGANKELFDLKELATIKEVGRLVERQLGAESLGRVSGSDTAQKIATMQGNGILDTKAANLMANKVPFLGAGLDAMRQKAIAQRNQTIGGLLADPQALAQTLRLRQPPSGQGFGLLEYLPLGYGVAPQVSNP